MKRPSGGSSFGLRGAARVVPVPGLLLIAHLAGGASGLLESSVLTVALALMGAQAFFRGRIGLDRDYRRGLRGPTLCLLLLLALALFSVTPGSGQIASGQIAVTAGLNTLSVDPEASWVEIGKLLGLATVFVLAVRYGSDADRIRQTVGVTVWLTTAWALWALLLYASSARTGDGPARLSGTFASPNVAACLLSIGLLGWLYLAQGRRWRMRSAEGLPGLLVLASAGLLLSGTLLLTASRSAIIIMAVLAVTWALRGVWLQSAGARSGVKLATTSMALAAVAILAYSASGFLQRLGGLGGEADTRWRLLGTYVGAAMDSPVFGHGLGTVPRISRLLLTPENDAILWNVRAVHNLPVQWWIEAGAVGLSLATLGLGWLLMISIRRLDPVVRSSMLPLFMITALMLAQGLVDYPAQIYSVALLWAFVLGLVYRAATGWAAVRTVRRPVSMNHEAKPRHGRANTIWLRICPRKSRTPAPAEPVGTDES